MATDAWDMLYLVQYWWASDARLDKLKHVPHIRGQISFCEILPYEVLPVDIGHPALIKLADTVNKKDLVGKIASDASLTRAQASRALDAFVQGIQASLVRGDRVTISGFGTFGVSHRKARRVRNPRSGSDMEVAAKRVPRFAPGADLRTAIDQPASNS